MCTVKLTRALGAVDTSCPGALVIPVFTILMAPVAARCNNRNGLGTLELLKASKKAGSDNVFLAVLGDSVAVVIPPVAVVIPPPVSACQNEKSMQGKGAGGGISINST